MNRILSRLRKKLLTENKIRRYLIYAIGETFLVVVGILIALSINNWNDQRKDHQRLERIYQSVRANLIVDTTNVTTVIKV